MTGCISQKSENINNNKEKLVVLTNEDIQYIFPENRFGKVYEYKSEHEIQTRYIYLYKESDFIIKEIYTLYPKEMMREKYKIIENRIMLIDVVTERYEKNVVINTRQYKIAENSTMINQKTLCIYEDSDNSRTCDVVLQVKEIEREKYSNGDIIAQGVHLTYEEHVTISPGYSDSIDTYHYILQELYIENRGLIYSLSIERTEEGDWVIEGQFSREMTLRQFKNEIWDTI
jgi:hypothetical protein